VLIGDYLLQAVLDTAPAAPPLAAAPFNDAALPLFEPPPAPAPAPVQLPPLDFGAAPVAAAAPAPAFFDPLAGASILDVGPGPGPGSGGDPLGLNLFAAAPAAPARAAESDHISPELAALPRTALAPAYVAPPPAPAPVSGGFAIPHDYDPLADLFPAAPAVAPAAAVMPTPVPTPVPIPAPAADAAAQAFADDTAVATEHVAPPAPPMTAPAQAPAPTPAPARTPASPASEDAVLQALLRGLGLPNLQPQRPATEFAETVGAMLRIATEGTIDVLMARALTKKESRIDMTMLSVRANNPLKFFPHADGALTQMLTGAMAGYMAPEEAMAGAFDDLRAHELAVIAGMRAALGAVLQRFDPAKIEARLAEPTVMDKMLSLGGNHRKAKLWDRLVELYGEIAREADDDLQRLYGEKFSEAYEEQVARLRAAKG
jgi:FHA domain-containing protein/type VI secretion system protein